MKISPIIDNYNPQYPNSNEVKDIGKVLNNKKPKRWLKNAAIAGLMLSMIGISSGCKKIPVNFKSRYEHLKEDVNYNFVAPLFEHGSGIGHFGCIVVTPPTYISEADAKIIIRDEFQKEGIYFDLTTSEYAKMIEMYRSISIPYQNAKQIKAYGDTFKSTKLTYDYYRKERNTIDYLLYNKKLKFGVIYMSDTLHKKITNFPYDYCASSPLQDFYIEAYKLIEELSDRNINRKNPYQMFKIIHIKNQRDRNSSVVFYNPVVYLKREQRIKWNTFEQRDSVQLEISKDSLRAQVRDFIHWFKNEKVWW